MKRDTPERVTEEGEGEPEAIKKSRKDHDGGKVIYDAYNNNVLDKSVLHGLMKEFHFSVPEMISAVIEHAVKDGMDAAAFSQMSGVLCTMAMETIKENNDREQLITNIENYVESIEVTTFPAIHLKDFPRLNQRKTKYKKELLELVDCFDEKLNKKYKGYIDKVKKFNIRFPDYVFFISHPGGQGGQKCGRCGCILMKLSYGNRFETEFVVDTPLCYFCARRYACDIEKLKTLKEGEQKQADICNTLTDFLNVMPKTF